MTTHAYPGELAVFIKEVEELVSVDQNERTLTASIAEKLTAHLANGLELPEAVTRPREDRYVMYPLHIDEQERFSIAAAVWNVGQGTPVHGHETWGVVGIYSGIEHELSFNKPEADDDSLSVNGESNWRPGQVTVCCTTDDDIHQVSCGSDEPCVGIHVYGANIGALPRRSYIPETGDVSWFTSTWATPRS